MENFVLEPVLELPILQSFELGQLDSYSDSLALAITELEELIQLSDGGILIGDSSTGSGQIVTPLHPNVPRDFVNDYVEADGKMYEVDVEYFKTNNDTIKTITRA